MSDYAVIDPATGEQISEYPTITDAELREAIAAADAAYKGWSETSTVEERAAILRRVGDLHKERSAELAAIIVREMGKTTAAAVGEIEFAGDIYHYYADKAAELMEDEEIDLIGGSGTAIVRPSAYGSLLGIMPWNYPYYQVARFAGPNLAIGNPILLKHAPQCPESSAAMQQIFDDAGAPEGVYRNIYATNEQIEWVIADPRIHGVSVTGSERAGSAVAEIAGRNLKKVVLELGGSDPFIVLDPADLDKAVADAAEARLENAGQACNAPKRFIVAAEHYDGFLEKFKDALATATVGNPSEEGTEVGPLSSKVAADRLEDQLQRAIADGAEVILGGSRTEGNYFEPTILAVRPGSDASQEEFFGPVAQVFKVESEEEAISLANDTAFGLGSYLYTADPEQAARVADQIEAGMVYINIVGADAPELPFGGFKRSGFGRELGRFGAEEFVNKKLIRAA
jgi:succinate-semialdehyde dehydrogenase/glutarate-semialdehyde dehydrogenase